MNQSDYQRHLIAVEGCDETFASRHAEQLYQAAEHDYLLAASMDPDDEMLGLDLVLKYLPAVLDEHDPRDVMELLDAKRHRVHSLRDSARHALRHLELIREHADVGAQGRLLAALTDRERLEAEPIAALELAKQFPKILRHYDKPGTAAAVQRVWRGIAMFRALPPVLSFTAPGKLPSYLDRDVIAECMDRKPEDVVRSDMIVPRRYLDPTDMGACGAAEGLHAMALEPGRDEFGMCTVVEAEDGTPVGSIKWENYPSMLGLHSVVDSHGRHAVMPGAIYKVPEQVQREVLDDENAGRRFARRRYKKLQVQPVRTLGDYWPGSMEYGDYRAMIAKALRLPELQKRG
jgi:hypothetical protein